MTYCVGEALNSTRCHTCATQESRYTWGGDNYVILLTKITAAMLEVYLVQQCNTS